MCDLLGSTRWDHSFDLQEYNSSNLRFRKVIGCGASGTVFLYHDIVTDVDVAVKVWLAAKRICASKLQSLKRRIGIS